MSSSLPAWAGRPALAGQRKQSTAQFVPKEARAPVSGETHSQQQFTAKQPVDPRRFPKDGAGRCTEPGVAPDVQTTARPLMKKPENSLKMTSKLHGASTLRQDFVPQTPTTTMGVFFLLVQLCVHICGRQAVVEIVVEIVVGW
eukprot:m.281835 g.281835  ORF g.281835 m.281835 type:complete len:143 (-) comp22894_c13_seq16:358-786(-)